jgi:hypothetical protein
MSAIRVVYRHAPPSFPATDQHPDAERHGPYLIGGMEVWADAVGGAPSLEQVAAFLLPPPDAADVKGEASWRIAQRFPSWKQANMTARGVELTFKLAQGNALAPEETAEIAALQAAWDWIKAVRAASDALEALDPIPADFADDARWPA